jgi:predicted RNA-binding Zn ribbon-like protein
VGCPPFGSQYQQTLSQEPTNRLTSIRRPERSRRLRFLQSPEQIQLCHTLQDRASTPRWAAAAERSPELTNEETAAIAVAKPDLLKVRPHIRAVLKATAAGQPLPAAAVAALNKASRAARHWAQIGPDEQLEEHAQSSAIERLLAKYARSAMAIATEGMPSASAAHHHAECSSTRVGTSSWCSEPCGNRARFARHYARHRAA